MTKKKKTRFGRFWSSKSLRFRFTITFILIMVFTILSSIIFNLYFLESFYVSQKKDRVIGLVGSIDSVMNECGYSDSGTELDDEMKSELEEKLAQTLIPYWRQDNINVLILNTDGKKIYGNENSMQDLNAMLMQYFLGIDSDTSMIYESDEFDIFFLNDNRIKRNRFLQAVGYLKNGCPFMISMPMESIKESANISNQFYILTGMGVVMIAATGFFLSIRRMVRPITELSRIAARMSDLDFSDRYPVETSDEVGTLGESMNHMADELEKSYQELKAANEQLQKDIEEKIQIDEMRKEFLSNVSHELKTPIAIISGYAEGLMDCVNEDEESRAFYCEVIMDESRKMNQMVQKLLNLNRLEFGNNALEIEDFDLEDLTLGVIEATRVMTEQKGGQITFDNQAGSMWVSGDEFMIEEVLKNYISNAVNHLAGELSIQVRAEKSGNNRIRVSVFNTGEPIPAESLDKVWIKFYKVDKARTREYGGSGIGLSIVKAIMEQHDCPYGVYNKEDGVVFWFELNTAIGEQDD